MPASPPPPLALAYHGIADLPPSVDRYRLFVRPTDFARQLRKLQQWGYEFVTFGELSRRVAGHEGAGAVSLTFDDALAGTLEVIKDFGIPATVFVVSGWLGAPHPDAPWSRVATVEELRAAGSQRLEFGGHTVTHPDLTLLSHEQAFDELSRCRDDLESSLATPVTTAAYPFGRANEALERACAAAGYSAACRCSGLGAWSRPFALPRQDMVNRCSLTGLRLKRDGVYERATDRALGRGLRWMSRSARDLVT